MIQLGYLNAVLILFTFILNPVLLLADAGQAIREVFENPTDPATQLYRFEGLQAMPENQVVTFAVAELNRPDLDSGRRAFAYHVLERCNGAKYGDGLEALVDGVKSEDGRISSIAAGGLTHASDEHRPDAIRALRQKLENVTPKSQESQAVLRALSSFGPASHATLDRIERIARNPDFRATVRSTAFSAIVSIGGLDHPILVDRTLSQNERSLRLYAVYVYGSELPIRSIVLGTEKDPTTAKKNATRLKRWSGLGIKLAVEQLKVADPKLRNEALSGLAMFAQTEAAVSGNDTGTFRLAPDIEKVLLETCEHDVSAHLRERACAIRGELNVSIERMKAAYSKTEDSPSGD